MKQSKLSFKTRRMVLNIITAIFAVAMILFYEFFTKTGIGVLLLIIFLVLFFILQYFWLRCTHCDTYFWKLPWFSEHCPYCGNKLE